MSRRMRRRLLTPPPAVLGVVALFAALVAVTPAQPAAAAISIGLTNVPVRILPSNSGGAQCLDAVGGPEATAEGAALQQYACQPRTQYNQVFSITPQGSTGYYSISVQSSEGNLNGAGVPATPLCLDVPLDQGGNGTAIRLYTCAYNDSSTQQLWNITADGSGWNIKSVRNASRCLDVQGGPGATQSGALIQIYDCIGASNQRFTVNAQPYPRVGMVYQSWFDYGPVRQGCAGEGWADGPFQTTPGSAAVQSLSTSVPNCYSSADSQAARTHAGIFDAMGVSFALIDDTNKSKTNTPAANGIYQASKQVVAGMSSQAPVIKSAYVLSLTCWQVQCYQDPANDPAWDGKEMAVWNASYAGAEVEDIAARYNQNPSQFEVVDGKPLVVLYVNQGNNVYCPRIPPAALQAVGLCLNASYSTLIKAFNGPGNIIPTTSEFNPPITVGGVQKRMNDVFSVRFGVVAVNATDFSQYDSRIWGWNCAAACTGSEAGYSAISMNGSVRNWAQAQSTIAGSLTAGGSSAKYLVVNAWNEFSSTDEYTNHSYTIEPNTYSHTVPGDESLGDPWYFSNKFKAILNKWR